MSTETKYWVRGYWSEGYWTEGYWTEIEEDAGAWWLFKQIRDRILGIKPKPIPVPVIGRATAQIGRVTVEGGGSTASPVKVPEISVLPPAPSIVIVPNPPAPRIGTGAALWGELVARGVGQTGVTGSGAATPQIAPVLGQGTTGVRGVARVSLPVGLRVSARVDHAVCSEEDLLALVAVAVQELDVDIREDELMAIVAAATDTLWNGAHPR